MLQAARNQMAVHRQSGGPGGVLSLLSMPWRVLSLWVGFWRTGVYAMRWLLVLSECVSASFAVCQGPRLISVAQSGVDTHRERADASIKVVLGRSNALGVAGNEPS